MPPGPSDPLYGAFVRMSLERRLFGEAGTALRVGRYDVERRLGAGGMSAVYLARDPELGRTVALKMLQSGARSERLASEARALAKLRHPHVVAVHDVGRHGEHPFLVIEHVEGATLREWARAPGRTWRDVARVGREVADGLGAVHALGLVHRDVKPDNVVVDAAGSARVLDFGLVAESDEPAAGHAPVDRTGPPLTQPDGTPGTPRYMAPERIAGARASAESDQYALGVTLDELLAGLDAPPSLKAVVRRARSERPEDRYPSLVAMRDALGSVLRPRWPRLGVAVAVSALAVGGIALAALAGSPTCDGRGRIAAHWDRAALEGHAPAAALRALDAYAARWAETHDALCQREQGDDAPPAARRAELHACLDVRLAAVDEVVRALAADDLPPEHATDLAEQLPSLSDCVLDATGPEDDPPIDLELAQGTTSEPARAAFRRGLRGFREGRIGDALPALEEAARLDPDYGAPRLWTAILVGHGDVAAARAPFAEARARRAGMGSAGRAMLEALTPCIASDPIDDLLCETRLAEVVHLSPRNAYAWYELARHRWNRDGTTDEVVDAFAHTLDADPGFALAHFASGQALAYLGRFDDALAAIDACLAAVPGATLCLRNRIWIRAHFGACEDVAADARRWIALDGEDANAYEWLAAAAAGSGEPDAAVAELLRQAVLRHVEPARTMHAARADAWLAILRGDFLAADRAAQAMEAAVEGSAVRSARLAPARLRIAIALETGDREAAARLAEAALETMSAWTPDPRVEDFAIARDNEPALLDALREAGALSDEARRARRADWLARWQARATPAYWPFLGLSGFARRVDDAAEAAEARGAEAELGLPPFHPYAYGASGIGRVRLLTGEPTEAIVHLERAAHGCHATELDGRLEVPMDAIQARLDLGRAREATGDVPGACAEYRAVLARWGAAQPRSVTAEAAAARSTALGCAP